MVRILASILMFCRNLNHSKQQKIFSEYINSLKVIIFLKFLVLDQFFHSCFRLWGKVRGSLWIGVAILWVIFLLLSDAIEWPVEFIALHRYTHTHELMYKKYRKSHILIGLSLFDMQSHSVQERNIAINTFYTTRCKQTDFPFRR